MTQPTPNPDCANCAALFRELERVNGRLSELETTVGRLAGKANQSSRNSSRPASSDPPWSKTARKRKAGGRKRGGQPGHPKAERALKPPEEVDCVENVVPDHCGCCNERLEGADPAPRRHQVTEIPPIRPQVTEYRLHTLECKVCGKCTSACLPEGVPSGAFGVRLKACVALLTGYYRVSRRNTRELLMDMLGVEISLGAISNIEGQVAEALAAPHVEAMDRIRAAATKHADETSWKQSGKSAWLWVAKCAEATAFLIRDSRSAKVARELLGDSLTGILISDRYGGYSWVDLDQRQVCWAHLFRDFRKIAESGTAFERIGEELETLGACLFSYWHRFREGKIPRGRVGREAEWIRKDMRALLDKGAAMEEDGASSVCRGILRVEPAMWTFVAVEGVEPTNNDAEQAIRRAVIWRKTSMGTQSARGSRFAERMLTCVATLRMHQRNVLDYLHHTCDAALRGNEPRTLFD